MPLCFDMPIDKLKTYQGVSPLPSDFDSFWDKSLSEMRAVKPEIDMKKADFQVPYAECYDLYFTGTGGARVYAKLLMPKNAAKTKSLPALLNFHGYSGASQQWSSYLGYVAAGFVVAALDCRGQGGKSEDKGGVMGGTLRGHIIRGLAESADKLYFRHVFLDTAKLAEIVMNLPEVNPARVGAYGGSQGGALTLACAALTPSIKKIAPVFPFLCDYKRVWQMDQAKDAYWELQDYFRRFDPNHLTEDEAFNRLGYIDCQNLAPRIKAEVNWIIGLMDTICPPSTQFAAYNKITSKKNMVIYPDFGHEAIPLEADKTMQFFLDL
ncbi:MAG: acetylxylan esterase [Fibrobacteres bacterium]|nr:acetylxylan esterase [Fibrobacterota bacterium]